MDAKELILGSKVIVCQLEVPVATTMLALKIAKENNGTSPVCISNSYYLTLTKLTDFIISPLSDKMFACFIPTNHLTILLEPMIYTCSVTKLSLNNKYMLKERGCEFLTCLRIWELIIMLLY